MQVDTARFAAADSPKRLVLLLPGWQGSGADHWQSRWEALHGYQRVEQADWFWPRRGDWMARLDDVVGDAQAAPAVLVAHSLGCQLVAAWAAHTRHPARVAAALLVAPPDIERADMPPQLAGWRPIVRLPLPFPSRVVSSADDPYCSRDRALAMASDWGASFVDAGAHGHLNADSKLGDWPAGQALLRALLMHAGVADAAA